MLFAIALLLLLPRINEGACDPRLSIKRDEAPPMDEYSSGDRPIGVEWSSPVIESTRACANIYKTTNEPPQTSTQTVVVCCVRKRRFCGRQATFRVSFQ